MTVATTRSVPYSETTAVLIDIDECCEEAVEQSALDINIRRGPFGAFTLVQATPCSQGEAEPCDDIYYNPTVSSVSYAVENEIFNALDTAAFSWPFESTDLLSNSFQAWDVSSPSQEFLRAEPLPQVIDLNVPWQPDLLFNGSVCEDVSSADAPILLKHYVNSVIPSMTPFRHEKTPWHVLFLPSAMLSMTALTIGEKVDEAMLTNFYGILAISALDLAHRLSDQKWATRAKAFKYSAQGHAALVLCRSLERPKPFKYKSTIIALATMAQLSVSIHRKLEDFS